MSFGRALRGALYLFGSLLIIPVILLFTSDEEDLIRRIIPDGYHGPQVQQGVIDLRDANLLKTIPLDGQWRFYRGRLLSPTELDDDYTYIQVPGRWHELETEGEPLQRTGVATYALTLRLPASQQALSFYGTELSSSYRLFVDGVQVAAAGEVGIDRASTRPLWAPLAASLVAQRRNVEVVLQVANFHHARGGLLDELSVSSSSGHLQRIRRQRELSWFFVGGLLLIGLHHIALFSIGTGDRSTLYFALAVLMMGLRTLATAPSYLLQPTTVIGWELLMKMEYLAMFAGVPFILLYSHHVFPNWSAIPVRKTVIAISTLFAAATLVTPTRVFSLMLPAYHPVSLFVGLYMTWIAIRAFSQHEPGSSLFLGGMVIMFVTIVNDILFNIGFVRTGYFASVGLFVFLFFHSLVLSGRVGLQYKQLERLYREKIRFQDLSLRDSLTGVNNRRYFDGAMEREWNRAIRDGYAISLIMLDIDHFKRFNDEYGHQTGDVVLRRVGNILTESVVRSTDDIARYGGEEFAIILPDTDVSGATQLAETIRSAIESIDVSKYGVGNGMRLTVSLGIASEQPKPGATSGQFIARADDALYRAKQLGRNRVAVY